MKPLNLKYLIIPAVTLATPWVHWVVYKNIMLAWPNAEKPHEFAIVLSVLSLFVFFFASIA